MRFNAAAVISTALLAGAVQAHGDHGAQKVVKDASAAAEASAKSVLNAATEAAASVASSASSVAHAALPTFTPSNIKADFLEQFTDDWEKRWKPSHAKKDMKGADVEEEWEYVGEWAVEEPKIFKGMEGDKGLVVKNAAAHHAISAKFPKAIDNKGKTLVVQYEVKLQNGLECGGAYLKLLRENKALHQEEFTNSSPYVVMFGPDKCGHTNKVHFIVNHKNPKTGEYEEKHLQSPPTARTGKTTELYTLIVKPDNTFVIKQNGDVVKEGNMLEDFIPAFNPPAEIEDPKDSKPETWVDQVRIPDPSATKPEDWDEEAPFEVVDEDATMPEDWLVDEPSVIPDPEAQKPEDWDDEEDGDWMAPMVPNPKCEDAAGCGPWTKPMKRNPAYKGPWTAPLIDNPEYKGPWAPRKIKNPAYFEDKHPANLEPMGAIGFEIWTMQNDIMFDNIYIGHSIEDAEKLANESFVLKKAAEEALELATKPKDADKKKKSPLDLSFKEDPVTYVKEKIQFFFEVAKKDPMGAIRFVPEVAIGLLLGALTVLGVLIGLLTSATAVPKAKEQINKKKVEKDVKQKTEAAQAVHEVAVGTAVDAAQNQEAVRRQTRSTAQVGQVREL